MLSRWCSPCAAARWATTSADLDGKIVILHTNDVHGAIAGYAQVAQVKADYEARGADVLLFDAGDYIQGDPSVSISQGATAIELMNLAGYDLAGIGNHEFDYGYENLMAILDEAEFDIVCANAFKDGEALSPTTSPTPPRTASPSASLASPPLRPPPRPTRASSAG